MGRQDLKLAVCVDIDGTLSDVTARRHLMPPKGSPRELWESFHKACKIDLPSAGIAELVRAMHPTHQVHIVSGRWEAMRADTVDWLAKHNIPYDTLRLYTADDAPTKNEVYKSEYVELLQERGVQPILFIEDEAYIANYIEQRTGVPVLCVNPGGTL